MRTKLLVAIVLFGTGLILLPMENAVRAQRLRMRYGGARVTFELREAIGQNLAIALLAGMRGVVADFLWLNAHMFWQQKEWLRQYRDMEVVVTLQPQSVLFLESRRVGDCLEHLVTDRYPIRKNRTKAEGIKREHEWHQKAREFLERGIDNIPNKYDLYFAMGWLYYEKLSKDCAEPPCRDALCRASEYFGKAAAFHEAPQYVPRVYARALESAAT